MPGPPPADNPDYPDELARLPHGRHGLPPEFVAHNQRERLIASITTLVSEVGYNEATISATTAGAGVSSSTFYKYFETIEECAAAALDLALSRVSAVVSEAFESEAEWPLQIRAALAAALDHLAADPAAARLLTAEPLVAGSVIAERHRAALERAVPYLRAGRELRPGAAQVLPDSTEWGILGAINALIARKIGSEGAERLPELLPDVAQFALTPYLGPGEARRVALGA